MHLRLFGSRLSTLLIRSGWIPKIVISCLLLLTVCLCWWLVLQRKLLDLQHHRILQIASLNTQKILFDEVLSEYKALNSELADKNIYKHGMPETTNCCKTVVDQARLANLSLQSYTTKQLKENFKQMIFTFLGNFRELLMFLRNLDCANAGVSCSRLKVVNSGYRLQIAYVCGIHTFVK